MSSTRTKLSSASLNRLTRPTKSTTAGSTKENSTNRTTGVKRARTTATGTVDPRAAKRTTTSRVNRTTATSRVNSTRTGASRPATSRTATSRTATSRATASRTASRTGRTASSRVGSRPGARTAATRGTAVDAEFLAQMKSTQEKILEQLAKNTAGAEVTLKEKEAAVSNLEGDKEVLMGNVALYQQQVADITASKNQLMSLMDTMKSDHRRELMDLEQRRSMLQIEKEGLEVEIRTLAQDLASTKGQVAQQALKITGLESKLNHTVSLLADSTTLCEERQATIDHLEGVIADLRNTIENLEERARNDEMARRKLHNTILELKGNIRVFCRVRPILPGEAGSDECYSFPDSTLEKRTLSITMPAGSSNKNKASEFEFDNVFSTHSTQGEVFKEISALVQSALDGYHVCIFTYGQTGSGKTYTMEGPDNPTEETRGMIPRAVKQIFETAETLKTRGWSYDFTADYLEIYNETIRDLLAKKSVDSKDLKIQHVRGGKNTQVTNLTYVPVHRPDQVHGLLYTASKNRATARTDCNERSSRSHSVFQLKINGVNSVTGEKAEGILNLVDLAGSERLKESKATGDRLKETRNINKSLACLGDVIAALANKDSHIPYRNSKLTYLLQSSLGGNSKTLMFVNISPNTKDLGESINSLRFATKVNACDIGVARKGGRHDLS